MTMTLMPNQRLHGFTVTRVRPCQELRGTLYEMKHDRTGAELCWLDNGLPNKLFSITFMTLPEDDTGVFHILEHSTLCGSRKYPVREPFVELLKSSMNTFLNAMTASDFTTYPVSSRNEKDYLNLVSIYLDAVFAPRFREDPNIFYQEGWHIETEPEMAYKGVVFNEMKGAMSGAGRVISAKLDKMLYPDTSYGFNSGGDPEAIPTLSYERFFEMYRRFYHPSNARIYLDGSVPLEKTLEMLEEYLSGYEKAERPQILVQVPKAGREENEYELDPGEDPEDKGRLSIGKLIGSWQDRSKVMAADVLFTALLDHNESPLMRAVLDSGLAQSVDYEIEDDTAQGSVILLFKDVKDGKEEELLALVEETAERLAKEGIDREDLEAALSRLSFSARQAQEPAGLMHEFRALSTWLYGGDPMDGLCLEPLIAEVRGMLRTDGFESLLREVLCDPAGRVVLVTKPSLTLGEERQAREKEALSRQTGAWDERALAENREKVARLVAWQATEDTPEQLATIPKLHLADIGEGAPVLGTQEKTVDGVRVLYHPGACPGLIHVAMYFTLSDLALEDLPRAQLMARVIGDLPTTKHSVPELTRLLGLYVGDYGFSVQATPYLDTQEACVRFAVTMSVLEEHFEPAIDLMAELLTQTCFEDSEHLEELIAQMQISNRSVCVTAGHAVGMTDARSHFSAAGAASAYLSGTPFIRFMGEEKRLDEGDLALQGAFMAGVQKKTFCRARLVLSLTAPEMHDLSRLTSQLPEGTGISWSNTYAAGLPMREAVSIPAQVGYAVLSAKAAKPYDPCWNVAETILSLGYLWNQVRVQGGAYGAGVRFTRRGQMTAYSYRDPTPVHTLQLYEGMADALEASAGEDIEQYIISTIAKDEPLLTPEDEGLREDLYAFTAVTEEMRRQERRRMLETDEKALRDTAGVIRELLKEAAVCVVAPQKALEKAEDLTPVALN